MFNEPNKLSNQVRGLIRTYLLVSDDSHAASNELNKFALIVPIQLSSLSWTFKIHGKREFILKTEV